MTEHHDDHKIDYFKSAMKLEVLDWKRLFPVYQTKLMICKGLNHCVHHWHLKVVGYLLTENNLFLVPHNSDHAKNKILVHLKSYMKEEIEREIEWSKKIYNPKRKDLDLPKIRAHHIHGNDIFKEHPLVNTNLIRILIGELEEPCYYSPEIKKLKDLTDQNFSSTRDIEGAEGPVELWRKSRVKRTKDR